MSKGYIIEKNGMTYSFKEDGTTFKLFHAKIGNWSEKYRGKIAAKLVDNGNCDFVVTIAGREIALNVSELAEISYFVDIMKATKPNTFNSTKVTICQK